MLAQPAVPAQHRLIDTEPNNHNMSTTTSATTTYPFTYTTFSNTSPSPFTKPTEVPSIFSFGSALNCAATSSNSAQPSALPSAAPLDRPLGIQAACVISNAAEVNNHAFWDLYACCKGGDMTAFGNPGTCTAQCRAEDGQTWQELGECLSKRVEVVVCKPEFGEIARNETSSSSSSSSSGSSAHSSTKTTTSASGSATASGSGAAQQSTGSKAGVVLFALLAFGSAAGMFL